MVSIVTAAISNNKSNNFRIRISSLSNKNNEKSLDSQSREK